MDGDNLPSNALLCGDETNNIYVARANISGSLCPGKYDNSLGTGLIPWGGVENKPTREEIQVKLLLSKFSIKHCYDHVFVQARFIRSCTIKIYCNFAVNNL